MREYFKNQIEQGNTDMFFYGLEMGKPLEGLMVSEIKIMRHKGSIDTFPQLEYVRHLTPDWPLFKEKS